MTGGHPRGSGAAVGSAGPAGPALPDYLPGHLGAIRLQSAADEVRLKVPLLGFERAAHMLRDAGARFVTLLAAESPERALVGVFALYGDLVVLLASADDDGALRYGSISNEWPAARWAEQELMERGQTQPVGFVAERALTRPDASAIERTIIGLDVFVMPFGPVRSGIFEAIQFQIETGGESVARIQTRPFFKHRGLEQRFNGLTPDAAVAVAERVAGVASVAHACAFAQAVEAALDVEPPPRAQGWRAVHAELERIACHLEVISGEAETAALAVGVARFQILKERVMRLRAGLSGSRFSRGVVVPGGVRAEASIAPARVAAELDQLGKELDRDRRLFLRTASMTDRLIGTGRMPRELLERYGAVGPLARGSGLSVDARHERPYGAYRRLGLRVITNADTDAMARIQVRFGEIHESLRILRQALGRLTRERGDLIAELPADASGSALGWTEAPQGEVVTWVEIRGGIVTNVHIASPSLRNWALFDDAFPKDVLTDFAFIEHSFGLTVAGADR